MPSPNRGAKVTSVVAGMLAGADSIDDLHLLRQGGMRRLFAGPRSVRERPGPRGTSTPKLRRMPLREAMSSGSGGGEVRDHPKDNNQIRDTDRIAERPLSPKG